MFVGACKESRISFDGRSRRRCTDKTQTMGPLLGMGDGAASSVEVVCVAAVFEAMVMGGRM